MAYRMFDGSIKSIDTRYTNVNDRIEIILTQNSEIDEIEGEIYNLKTINLVNLESVENPNDMDLQMGKHNIISLF